MRFLTWLWCFVSIGVATVLSALIYWQLLVPRLPKLNSVPLIWWLLVCAPVIVTFVTWLLIRPFDWLPIAVSAALGVDAAWISMDAIRSRGGLPVAHDLYFGTSDYLSSVTYRSVILLLLFVVVGWTVSRFVARSSLNSETPH